MYTIGIFISSSASRPKEGFFVRMTCILPCNLITSIQPFNVTPRRCSGSCSKAREAGNPMEGEVRSGSLVVIVGNFACRVLSCMFDSQWCCTLH